ncbi:MAG: hypothetical protein AAF389_05450 [Gemmatimonadota bacterium]
MRRPVEIAPTLPRMVAALGLSVACTACSSGVAPILFGIDVEVFVVNDGGGEGGVQSTQIATESGTISLDCTDLGFQDQCSIEFVDQGGSGQLTLTATPNAGSEFGGWAGSSCTPSAGCTITASDEVAVLTFTADEPVRFNMAVTFAAPPPLPTASILFESHRDGNAEVFVMGPDGSGKTNLSNNPAEERDPVWSPDRMEIAFVSDREGDDALFTMDADGMNVVRRTNHLGNDRRPTWSPDGARIAFDNDGDGDDEIWVVNADGTSPTQLTFNTSDFDQDAMWSPSSDRILFTSFQDGVLDNLYIMDDDGLNQSVHVNTGHHDWQPDWSPDGTMIVFTQQHTDTGNDEIWVVNADGQTGLRQLTFNDATDREPTWSPDGEWIAFTSTRAGNRDIYIMTKDGTFVRQLTSDSAEDSQPSWVH